MKKGSLSVVIAILLVVVMLLTSCMGKRTGELSDLLDSDAEFTQRPTYWGNFEENLELLNFTFEERLGDLYLFHSSNYFDQSVVYAVYDIKNDDVVYRSKEKIRLTLGVTDTGAEFFYEIVGNTRFGSYKLYSKNGELIAPAEGEKCRTAPKVIYDTVYFDGKCYRADENENLIYAFDYSSLAYLPEITYGCGGIYYETHTKYIAAYDSKLNFLYRYLIPDYAQISIHAPLANGDLLIQYSYPVDKCAEDHDFILEEIKYRLETKIISPKWGTVKDIDCPYLICIANNRCLNKDSDSLGIDLKKYPLEIKGYEITDRQVDMGENCRYLYLTEKDEIREFDTVRGEYIVSVLRMEQDRYVIETEKHKYLVNEKGEVLQELPSDWVTGKYLDDGKCIRDLHMNVVFNYDKHGYTVFRIEKNVVFFQNYMGDIFVCRENGNLKRVADVSEGQTIHQCYDGIFVLTSKGENRASMFAIFSNDGESLFSREGVYATQKLLISDGGALFCSFEGRQIRYYRISA